VALLFVCSPLAAYEEKPADTLAGGADTLREAIRIDIASDRIRLRYDDGSDSLMLRTDRAAGAGGLSARDQLIAIGRDEAVTASDSLRGDIFIAFGNLEVAGYIKGDIKVFFGDVIISPTGVVEGDVFCLGEVKLSEGSHLWGNIKAYALNRPEQAFLYDFRGNCSRFRLDLGKWQILGPPALTAMLGFLAIVIIAVIIVTIILPSPVARVRFQIEAGFAKCLLMGLLLTIIMFPLWILILVTIIGIPIAILIFPFVVVGAYALGAIGFTQFAGFWLGRQTTLRYEGYLRTTLAGILLLGSALILAAFFSFINIDFLARPLYYIHLFGQIVMFLTGMGAVFFSRFGTRPQQVALNPTYAENIPRAEVPA